MAPRTKHAVCVGNINLVRCLGAAGIPVYLAAPVSNRVAAYSRYTTRFEEIPGPTLFPEQFVAALVRIGQSLDAPAALYYDSDADLEAISQNRAQLSPYYRMNLPSAEIVDECISKDRFATLARKYDLPVPPSLIVNMDRDVRGQVPDELFPVVVKPMTRVGWLENDLSWRIVEGGKAILAESADVLSAVADELASGFSQMLVQRLIPGDESNIVSYHCYADPKGGIVAEYTGRKVRTYPLRFGRSAEIVVEPVPGLIEAGREVVEKIRLPGVAKLDFKLDTRTGKLFLLEINPRYSIWNWPGTVAGVNLPAIAYRDVLGLAPRASRKAPSRVTWVDGKANRLAVGSVRALFSVLRHGFGGRRRVFTLWRASDPLPFAAYLCQQLLELPVRATRKLARSLPGRAKSHARGAG